MSSFKQFDKLSWEEIEENRGKYKEGLKVNTTERFRQRAEENLKKMIHEIYEWHLFMDQFNQVQDQDPVNNKKLDIIAESLQRRKFRIQKYQKIAAEYEKETPNVIRDLLSSSSSTSSSNSPPKRASYKTGVASGQTGAASEPTGAATACAQNQSKVQSGEVRKKKNLFQRLFFPGSGN